jgi:hypothetical protein
MQFSPAIDHRLRASVRRTVDLGNAAEVWRGLRRRGRRLSTATPCYESVRKLVVAERERRARLIAGLATLLEIATRRVPVLPRAGAARLSTPAHLEPRAGGRGDRRASPSSVMPCRSLVRFWHRPQIAREKARAASRRPSIPVASVGFGRGASCLASRSKARDRRRGTRAPYARLWRFPSGSRGHASTRWYLHCRYCWNLSRPDHLLSAVSHHVYRPGWTTASP